MLPDDEQTPERDHRREAEHAGRASDALALAREAFGLAPERIAVTSRLAELQIKAGDAKRAMKTLERGWAVAPHPDLAELYLRASGESDPLKRVGIVRRLATGNPDDIESHLALAKASLDAGLWGEARRQLETAGGTSPPVRICRLMAEVPANRARVSRRAPVHLIDGQTRPQFVGVGECSFVLDEKFGNLESGALQGLH